MRTLKTGSEVHGESGLDGPALPPPAFMPEAEGAQELLYRIIRDSPEPITMVPIGPETNVATLLRDHPEIKPKVGLISLMGGALEGGNISAAAEFNIWTDPDAARIVFSSGIPIVMSGLDVTHKAYVSRAEIDRLRGRGKASKLVAELLAFYGAYYEKIGMPGPALHDPCSIAYLVRPDIFQYRDLFVDIETKGELTLGMTVAERRPSADRKPNARALVDVDRDAFIDLLFEGLSRLDRETSG